MVTKVLRVYGQSGIRATEIREYLAQLEHAYNSIYTFEALVEAYKRAARHIPSRFYELGTFYGFPLALGGRMRFLVSWPPTPDTVAAVVLPRHRLVVHAVRLESPGFWDFVGKLNPLEVLRLYLNDRHERRKDREYREAAEARKLELENQILESKVLRERIEIARELGATEQDLAPLLNELVYRPLAALDRHQDRGVIEAAEILDLR